MKTISICGVDCTTCREYGKTCNGCEAIQGKVFWAPYMELDCCPIYRCCKDEKKHDHCGKCNQLPCQLYIDTRDPSYSEEEHLESIKERVKVLKAL